MTVQNSPYPTPVSSRQGFNVAYYTYDNLEDAKRASVTAEQIALKRWNMNSTYLYNLPGEIVANKDKTFTVIVV